MSQPGNDHGGKALAALLDLERLEENLYRGQSPATTWQRVFGGQVVAQSLVATQRTAPEGHLVHSLHGYFMRPGDTEVPIIFQVERLRDGRSFSTRSVRAIQHGQPIFIMTASFQIEEDGFEHQHAMPDVPPPEELAGSDIMNDAENAPAPVRNYWMRERPIEIRPVDLDNFLWRKKPGGQQNIWIRANGPSPHGRDYQTAFLAYMSDMTLLDATLYAHQSSVFSDRVQAASLDHAVWFHRPFETDDWLLYSQESPSANGGRGFAHGRIFSRDGTLVASVAQEGLIRIRDHAWPFYKKA
ncbi:MULTISPECIES: acyl-CoA thioesterase II [Martelella]|uniref:Acyl-CoA thioesterase 2 n=1 Tax=Martelella mediterranea DSM 17316 TaxID=1122214 RepID=A0A1U9YYD4_9HYPH|nr:acyl-CoA thioesterase II [Martelella mediterranea]AQZ50382.1 Acyl-CoA thioesterase 2 [Martelella mediterranea DSM 17316]